MLPPRSRRAFLALLPSAAAAAPGVKPSVPLALPVYSDARNLATVNAILDCVAEGAGLQWQVQHVPQARLQLLVESGEALGLSAELPTAHESLRASLPLFSSRAWVIVHRDSEWAEGRELKGGALSICVIRNDRHLLQPLFERSHGAPRRVELVDGTSEIALRMVARGRCDALLLGARLDHAAHARRIAERSEGLLRVLNPAVGQYPISLIGRRDSAPARWLPAVDRAISDCAPRIQGLLGAEQQPR